MSTMICVERRIMKYGFKRIAESTANCHPAKVVNYNAIRYNAILIVCGMLWLLLLLPLLLLLLLLLQGLLLLLLLLLLLILLLVVVVVVVVVELVVAERI